MIHDNRTVATSNTTQAVIATPMWNAPWTVRTRPGSALTNASTTAPVAQTHGSAASTLCAPPAHPVVSRAETANEPTPRQIRASRASSP